VTDWSRAKQLPQLPHRFHSSKQVNGGALQKETFTARLLLYVYVGYSQPPPPKKKLAGSASISGMVSGKSWMDMSTPVHPVATPLILWNCTHTA